MTISSKTPSRTMTSTISSRLWRAPVRGLLWGGGAGLAIVLLVGLNPFAGADRPALSLIAVTLSLPLGVSVVRLPPNMREAGREALAALVSGLALASLVAMAEPALWVRTASWCAAAALLGGCLALLLRHPAGGFLVTLGWLFMCGLPFFYDRLGLPALEDWALQGSPWLGFASDAFGGDPLRRSVIYMGQWSGLSSRPAEGLLQSWLIWLLGALALVGALLRSSHRERGER